MSSVIPTQLTFKCLQGNVQWKFLYCTMSQIYSVLDLKILHNSVLHSLHHTASYSGAPLQFSIHFTLLTFNLST